MNLTKTNLNKMSKADLISNLEASGINTDSLRDLTKPDLITAILEMKDQFDAAKQAEQEAAAILTDADATVEPEVTEAPVTEEPAPEAPRGEEPAPEAPQAEEPEKAPKATKTDRTTFLATLKEAASAQGASVSERGDGAIALKVGTHNLAVIDPFLRKGVIEVRVRTSKNTDDLAAAIQPFLTGAGKVNGTRIEWRVSVANTAAVLEAILPLLKPAEKAPEAPQAPEAAPETPEQAPEAPQGGQEAAAE